MFFSNARISCSRCSIRLLMIFCRTSVDDE